MDRPARSRAAAPDRRCILVGEFLRARVETEGGPSLACAAITIPTCTYVYGELHPGRTIGGCACAIVNRLVAVA